MNTMNLNATRRNALDWEPPRPTLMESLASTLYNVALPRRFVGMYHQRCKPLGNGT